MRKNGKNIFSGFYFIKNLQSIFFVEEWILKSGLQLWQRRAYSLWNKINDIVAYAIAKKFFEKQESFLLY